MDPLPAKWQKLARAAGAFVLTDLITGLAAFSMISLAGLWYFSFSWISIASEYAPRGVTLGSPWQLELAWIGLVITLPLFFVTAYLAYAAYGLPRMVWAGRRARSVAA
jgi:hypothetical protein